MSDEAPIIIDERVPVIASGKIMDALEGRSSPLTVEWQGHTLAFEPDASRRDVILALSEAAKQTAAVPKSYPPITDAITSQFLNLAFKLSEQDTEAYGDPSEKEALWLMAAIPLIAHSVKQHGLDATKEALPQAMLEHITAGWNRFEHQSERKGDSHLQSTMNAACYKLLRGMDATPEKAQNPTRDLAESVELVENIRHELAANVLGGVASLAYDTSFVIHIARAQVVLEDLLAHDELLAARTAITESQVISHLNTHIAKLEKADIKPPLKEAKQAQCRALLHFIESEAGIDLQTGSTELEDAAPIEGTPDTHIEGDPALAELETIVVRKHLREAGVPSTDEVVAEVRASLIARQQEEARPRGLGGLLERLRNAGKAPDEGQAR